MSSAPFEKKCGPSFEQPHIPIPILSFEIKKNTTRITETKHK